MKTLTINDTIKTCKTAVALGIFDGLHLGHQMVIREAISLKSNEISPAVFSFKTSTVTSKGGKFDTLISDELKSEMLNSLGVEYILSPEFGDLKNMTAYAFAKKILHEVLNCRYAICGEDFRFGKGGTSNAETLTTLGKDFGFEVIVIPNKEYLGERISSTKIRALIRDGKIREANTLLGYNFHFKIEVSHGNELGRTLNFPTINQIFPKEQVIPKYGVYASTVNIDGKLYNGVSNVGVKPTIREGFSPLAETYILNFSGDLYGKSIDVSLIEFLRPEEKFDSIEELKRTMDLDLIRADEIHSKLSNDT